MHNLPNFNLLIWSKLTVIVISFFFKYFTKYYFTLRIRRKFVIILSPKIPPHLNCVATLPCENVKCLTSNNRKQDHFCNKHFKSALSISKADTLNIWCKNCRMWQLLWTITETTNTSFPVVNFLKCVVTKVVLFSIIAFNTRDISQGSVAT